MDHEAKGLRGSSRSKMPPSAGAPAAPPARERVKVGDAGPHVSALKQAPPPSRKNSTRSGSARRTPWWYGDPSLHAQSAGEATCSPPAGWGPAGPGGSGGVTSGTVLGVAAGVAAASEEAPGGR